MKLDFITRKLQEFLKCLDLMTSTQAVTKKPYFDVFDKISQKNQL